MEAQKPGFFTTKRRVVTDRLGKKPGFFVGLRPGVLFLNRRPAFISENQFYYSQSTGDHINR